MQRKDLLYSARDFRRLFSLRSLILVFLLGLGMSLLFLRLNNLHTAELKEAVIMADNEGTELQSALVSLQSYVTSTMNADMGGPVELTRRYNTAVYDEHLSAFMDNNLDKSRLDQVWDTCRNLNTESRFTARCAQQEILKENDFVAAFEEVELPLVELYSFQFSPPSFSFDRAGISIIFTTVTGIIICSRLLSAGLLKILHKG